ncbi:PREDICTED: putative FBD-associated F-box protein At5g50270 [Camelina sativa]|uniref:FBD-associated F-box protein At5g50270 n=1 Tax=Camelina sativa TaxID=90675 RepID=A0ABM0WQ86_CAMSA|nr:PREDICTED: putative FBD-associated F-box protein At5g50270 [Camelina sativa]
MDQLPEELLLRILSFLPTMNDVVATMEVSLDVCAKTHRSLFLHEAPVIETLHFKLGQTCGAEDIRVWIRAAEKCSVRELHIKFVSPPPSASPTILPRSRMLVTLRLIDVVLVDDRPDDNVTIFTIRVPSLKLLRMLRTLERDSDNAHGFVIDVPSLETLEIRDFTDGGIFFLLASCGFYHSAICTIGNSWYSCDQDAHHVGSIFHHLVEVTLCTCDEQWLNLLLRLLGDSPKLRSLRLSQYHAVHDNQDDEPSPCWIKLSSVPKMFVIEFRNSRMERL